MVPDEPASASTETPKGDYRAIDPDEVVATLETLESRIDERFPDRGLGRVCGELVTIARQAKVRAESFDDPIIVLRVLTIFLAAATVIGTIAVFMTARLPEQAVTATELIQILEAGINDVVLIGAAIFFLATFERRIKRGRALRAIHELRAVAHIVDLHQLTKDPERLLHRGPFTAHSPKQVMTPFELGRYLDYCSEMLSLTGKIAALYVQRFDDEVALQAVNEVEDLCTGLSNKIWQKIMVIDTILGSDAPAPQKSVD